MALEKKRWIILIASCLINLCIGSLYAWSVFATPMAMHFNESRGLTGASVLTAANLAIIFTVANLVGPITMISGGFINDTLGPRWVILVGAVLFGGVFFSKRLFRKYCISYDQLWFGLWTWYGYDLWGNG